MISKKSIHDITNFDYSRILSLRGKKNLKATILFVDFSKVFDSIHRGKREQMLITSAYPKQLLKP